MADNDAATLGYLRKSDLSHKAEIQMLITLAEVHGIKVTYNEKDGEVTVERVEGESQPIKGSTQTQQSFAQLQRTSNQPPDQPDINYVRLTNALKEPIEKALQNAVESSPVHIQAIFDTSVHMENNQTAMPLPMKNGPSGCRILAKKPFHVFPMRHLQPALHMVRP